MPRDWDQAYAGHPPWDIGRPQPVFVVLAQEGLLRGRLLDAGCGTGEHTLLAAESGADAFGVDRAARAIEIARAKAAERGIEARFAVANALRLEELNQEFDTVIDSGLFHVFDDEDRTAYVASLERVVGPGGRCLLMCFSEHQPGDLGPRRVTQDELRSAFAGGWEVRSIAPASFEVREGFGAHAWLAILERR
jgi:ubiquinone/menaquinone biosynthesis C-methylase UbiE